MHRVRRRFAGIRQRLLLELTALVGGRDGSAPTSPSENDDHAVPQAAARSNALVRLVFTLP
jgi:hypothetical protein